MFSDISNTWQFLKMVCYCFRVVSNCWENNQGRRHRFKRTKFLPRACALKTAPFKQSKKAVIFSFCSAHIWSYYVLFFPYFIKVSVEVEFCVLELRFYSVWIHYFSSQRWRVIVFGLRYSDRMAVLVCYGLHLFL